MMAGAFLWGFLVAPLFAGFANDLWGIVIAKLGGADFAADWSAALTAPVNEEIYKYLGLAVLYLIARTEFDDLLDGFVYGALIGLGFAVAEDLMYFIFNFGGSIDAVVAGLLPARRAVRVVRPRDVHRHRRRRLRLLRHTPVRPLIDPAPGRRRRAAAAGHVRALLLELAAARLPARLAVHDDQGPALPDRPDRAALPRSKARERRPGGGAGARDRPERPARVRDERPAHAGAFGARLPGACARRPGLPRRGCSASSSASSSGSLSSPARSIRPTTRHSWSSASAASRCVCSCGRCRARSARWG